MLPVQCTAWVQPGPGTCLPSAVQLQNGPHAGIWQQMGGSTAGHSGQSHCSSTWTWAARESSLWLRAHTAALRSQAVARCICGAACWTG